MARKFVWLFVVGATGLGCRSEVSSRTVSPVVEDRSASARTRVQARVRIDGDAAIPRGASMRIRVRDLDAPGRAPVVHERRLDRPEDLSFALDVETAMHRPAAEIEVLVGQHVRFATAEPTPLRPAAVNEVVVHVVASSLRGDPTDEHPFAAGMPPRPSPPETPR